MAQGDSATRRAGLDLDAVTAVARVLDLTWRITVIFSGRFLRDQGFKAMRTFRHGEHVIRIRPDLARDELNSILLHELYHCRQAELLGADWPRRYQAARRAAPSYAKNPFEVAADAFAADLAKHVRLVTP